jgi:hypothetical protein
MIEIVISVILILVGLINFVPSFGIISAEKLSKQYDTAIDNIDLTVLMQHRALMLGVIGAFIFAAAFFPPLQKAAFLIGLTSMLGFVLIAKTSVGHNQKLAKVATIDIFASALLGLAGVLDWLN